MEICITSKSISVHTLISIELGMSVYSQVLEKVMYIRLGIRNQFLVSNLRFSIMYSQL